MKADVPPPRAPMIERRGALIAAIALFGAFAALPPVATALGDPFLVVTMTRILAIALAALSLDLILGYGAMVSFGHAAFIGIGAYAVAVMTRNGIPDFALQTLVAVGASALFALVTGAISLRTKGVYFIMITLAFGQMAYFFTHSLSAYGGDDGFTLPTRSLVFGTEILENDVVFYYVALGLLAAAFVFLRLLIGSRFGRVLRGIHDNRGRMEAIGFPALPYQLTAYVIAGAIAGVAGVLLANQTEFVSPAYMTWQRSGELIIMVVLGGMGTLLGPILGAVGFLMLEEIFADISQHWKLGVGVVLVIIVITTRGGLAGGIRRLFGGRS
jgi:branched-chain amino acid transport system permease protein